MVLAFQAIWLVHYLAITIIIEHYFLPEDSMMCDPHKTKWQAWTLVSGCQLNQLWTVFIPKCWKLSVVEITLCVCMYQIFVTVWGTFLFHWQLCPFFIIIIFLFSNHRTQLEQWNSTWSPFAINILVLPITLIPAFMGRFQVKELGFLY